MLVVESARRLLWPCLAVVLLTAIHWPAPAPAQLLTLAEAERLALVAEPGVEAHQERAAALAQQAIAEGQWPDPKVFAGMINLPLDSFNRSADPMTQLQLGVRQDIPVSDTLRGRAGRLTAQSAALEAKAAQRRLWVLHELRLAWLDFVYQQSARELLEETRLAEEEAVSSLMTAYANGLTDQASVQAARARPLEIAVKIIESQEQSEQARARIRQWLPQLAGREIDLAWPSWPAVPAIERMRQGLALHPLIHEARARGQASEAAIAVANSLYQPGFAVEASYSLRSGEDALGRNRSDLGSIRVTMDLPLFTARRQDPRLRAARGEQAAALADEQSILRELRARLDAAYARHRQLQQRLSLYQQDIIPTRELQMRSAQQAYGSGTGGFAAYSAGSSELLHARLQALDLRRQWLASRVALAFLSPNDDAIAIEVMHE